jgi:BirA family biotin operon repressor/biotin-[acetyl-CoA-carboxylase] ligase
MPYKLPILRLLSDGRPHSADEVIAAGGLAPAELAPALADLLGLGVGLDAHGGFVQLTTPIELLERDTIAARLPPEIRLAVVDRCESTNSLVADLARDGAPSGTAVACELQTAGRGRRGAPWLAPFGTSLAFSLLWRFPAEARSLGGLSLAVGVACSRAFERLGASGIGLKWPNDVLWEGRKVCGILIEIVSANDAAAVIGIGVNVCGADRLSEKLPYPVADLQSAGVSGGRNAVLGEMLAALGDACARFDRSGFGAFRGEWERRHAHAGQRVRLLNGESEWQGTALGVDDDGALLVTTERGLERFMSGEVSLR